MIQERFELKINHNRRIAESLEVFKIVLVATFFGFRLYPYSWFMTFTRSLVLFTIIFVVMNLKTVTAQLQETSEFLHSNFTDKSFIKTKWCLPGSYNKSRSTMKLSELSNFETIIGMRSPFWYWNAFTWEFLSRSIWGILFKLKGIMKSPDGWCVRALYRYVDQSLPV